MRCSAAEADYTQYVGLLFRHRFLLIRQIAPV